MGITGFDLFVYTSLAFIVGMGTGAQIVLWKKKRDEKRQRSHV